jgi:hypothetical protein
MAVAETGAAANRQSLEMDEAGEEMYGLSPDIHAIAPVRAPQIAAPRGNLLGAQFHLAEPP